MFLLPQMGTSGWAETRAEASQSYHCRMIEWGN